MNELLEGKDFYWEGPYLVFTASYHLRKGSCCGSRCRHCPYEPRWIKGTATPALEWREQEKDQQQNTNVKRTF